jgi:hypothetical protein
MMRRWPKDPVSLALGTMVAALCDMGSWRLPAAMFSRLSVFYPFIRPQGLNCSHGWRGFGELLHDLCSARFGSMLLKKLSLKLS